MKAIIDIPKDINGTLGIIKIQNNFKNKSETISAVVRVYESLFLDEALNKDFVNKILKISKNNSKRFSFKNIADFEKEFEK
jgi:hypothetical protein